MPVPLATTVRSSFEPVVMSVATPERVRLPEAVRAAEFTVPVKVGLALKTRLPAVPVVPVTELKRFAAVMVLVSWPPVVVATSLLAVRPLKVIVPDDVTPVAAVMAPEELTWKASPEPTVKRLAGDVSPIPTLPVEVTRSFSVTDEPVEVLNSKSVAPLDPLLVRMAVISAVP